MKIKFQNIPRKKPSTNIKRNNFFQWVAEILDLVLTMIVSEVAIHFGEIHFIRVSDMTEEDQGEDPGNTCQGEVPMNMVAEIEKVILTKGEEDMEVQLILQFK